MKISSLLAAMVLMAAPLAAQGGFLGVNLDPEQEGSGATVVSVREGTAAELGGLKGGDVILMVGETKVGSVQDLIRVLGSKSPGQAINLRIRRNGEVIQKRVVLGRRPEGLETGPPPEFGDAAREANDVQREALEQALAELEKDIGKQVIEQALEKGEWKITSNSEGPVAKGEYLEMTKQVLENMSLMGRESGDGSGVMLRLPADVDAKQRKSIVDLVKKEVGPKAKIEFKGEQMMLSFTSNSPEHMGFLDEEIIEEVVEEPIVTEDPIIEEPMLQDVTHGASDWHQSLEHALAAARRSGKPVLVDFYADWCGPCKRMGRDVLHNPEHAGSLARFEKVQVNIDKHGKLAEEYGVQGIPDVRVLASNGKQMTRIVGYSNVERTLSQLNDGYAKAKAAAPAVRLAPAASRALPEASPDVARNAELAARRAAIEARIAEIEAEIAAIQARLAEMGQNQR